MKQETKERNIKSSRQTLWLLKPRLIRMGISRACNFRCLMCWSYSPFLNTPPENNWRKVKIDKNLAIRIIREAAEIGFRLVLFSGFGEPFTHPNMMDFVKETSRLGLGSIIQTNLSLVDAVELTRALKGVEKESTICANVGAVDPKTYKEIHRNVEGRDFYVMLEKMKFLLKNNVRVRMVHVVIKPNYQEIKKVLELNKKIGSFLHLELADFVPGEGVERIALDQEERRKLFNKLSYLRGKDHEMNSNISDFLAQVKYRGIGMPKIKRCLIGYNFCATNEIGKVYYCFNRKSTKFFMGDLNHSSLKEIWFSDKYNAMRKRLRAGRFFKECKNYCANSNCVNNSRSSNFKIRFYIDSTIPSPLS